MEPKLSAKDAFIVAISEVWAFQEYPWEGFDTQVKPSAYYFSQEILEKFEGVDPLDLSLCLNEKTVAKFAYITGKSISYINTNMKHYHSVCYLPAGWYNIPKLVEYIQSVYIPKNKKVASPGRPKKV